VLIELVESGEIAPIRGFGRVEGTTLAELPSTA